MTDTITMMKQRILDMAIRGELVEHRQEEGTAEELLARIEIEKENLIKKKKIKKEKKLPKVEKYEKPFTIPENWEWVRIGTVINAIFGGGTPSKTNPLYWNGEIPWTTVKDISVEDIYLNESINFITEKGYNNCSGNMVNRGDIIVITRMGLGRIVISNIKTAINQDLKGIKLNSNVISKLFLYFYKTINIIGTGTTVKGIKQKDLLNTPFPLPPMEEQKRIVERIEESFAIIDKIAEKREDTIQTLEKIRSTTLQEAIKGNLVKQNENDEPASELIKQINEEKGQLIKEKIIKKGKKSPKISVDEVPFDLPEKWEWVRLKDLVYNKGQKKPDQLFSYIDISSIDNIKHKLSEEEKVITPEKAPSRARKIVSYGDIVYSTVRPYLQNVCIVDRVFSEEPIASTGFEVMTTHTGVLNKYLFYYLISPTFDNYANDTQNAKGTAYPAINASRFYNGIVPLPPLADQKRIVNKIESIMVQCDEIERKIM